MSKPDTKTAIVYYSKSGHSRRAAELLADILDTDLHQLKTTRYRTPFLSYLRAGLDSLRLAKPSLAHPLPELKRYDALVIRGPIWTSYPAAPLRSYFQQVQHLPATLGLLLTYGDHSPPEKAYALVEQELGHPLAVTAAIANDREMTTEEQRIFADFAATLHKVTEQE
ncbi:hypothetical protein [Yoonia sp. R2-816]|uniref:hypothetical protein n=1 Tax=Yoonia sp. R2-816 TaxID=3342638 RepID=UPI003727B318